MSKSGGNKLTDDKKSIDLKNANIPQNLLMIEKIKEIAALPYITDDDVYKQLKLIYDHYPHVSKKALNSNNQTPLIHAAILGMPSVIRALYKLTKGNPLKDPEINHFDNQNKTALMYAISYKDDGEKTADPNILKRRATIDLLINTDNNNYYIKGELNAQGEVSIKNMNKEYRYNPNAHLAFACFHGNLYFVKKLSEIFINRRMVRVLNTENLATYVGIAIVKNKEIAKYFINQVAAEDFIKRNFLHYIKNLLQYIIDLKSEQGFQNLIELGVPIRLIKFELNKGTWQEEGDIKFLENQISNVEHVNSTVDSKENLPPPAFNPGAVPAAANPIHVVPNASAPAFEPPPYSEKEGLAVPPPIAAPPSLLRPTPMDLLAGIRKDEASHEPVIRIEPVPQRKEDSKVNISIQRSSLYAPPQSGSPSGIPIKQPIVRNNYSEKLKNLLTMLEAAEKEGDPELLSRTLELIGPRIENIGTNMKNASAGLGKDDKKIERPPSPA